MRLSFDDEESFEEAAGSLRFNNPSSDTSTSTPSQMGSSSSIQPQDSERNEDNNPTNDPNTLQQMGGSSISLQEGREDT